MIVEPMKFILVLLAAMFSAPFVLSQDMKKPQVSDSNTTGNWSKLGPTVEGPRGFTLHGRGIRINSQGQYELSVRITPVSLLPFIKRYDLPKATSFVVQFATIDCEKRLVSLEKTEIFGVSGQAIEGKITGITPSSRKESVRPGSIGEALYRFVCVETTSLPMTKGQN